MADTPLYTEQDKRFLSALKAKGYTKEDAFAALDKVKAEKGVTSTPTPGFLKAGAQNIVDQGANVPLAQDVANSEALPSKIQPPKASVGGVLSGKQNIYGETLPGESDFSKKVGALESNTEAITPLGLTKALLKAGGSLASEWSSLGEKGLQAITGINKGQETAGEKAASSEILKPTSATEGVVKGVAQVALPLLAGGAITAPLRSLGAAGVAKLTGSKLLQAIGANLAASPIETAIVTSSTQGELPSAQDLTIGAVIDAALPVVGKLLSKGSDVLKKIKDTIEYGDVSPMTQNVVKKVLSSSDDSVKAGFLKLTDDYDNYMKNMTTANSPMADLGDDLYKTFTETIVPQKQAIGQELASQISQADELAQAGAGLTSDGVLKSLSDGLSDIGVKVGDNGLDFSSSTIRFSDANQSMLNKVYADVSKYVDEGSFIPTSEKWTLAQSLGDLTEYNSKMASQVTGKGEVPIVKLKSALMDDVKSSLEQSGQAVDLFDQYKAVSDVIDTLNRRFGEGGTGGFSVMKSIFGEQKFGSEVKSALKSIKDMTGIDYAELAKITKAAGEMAGDEQVKSLLSTTSAKGLVEKVAQEALFSKDAILEKIADSMKSSKVKVSRGALEAIVSATLKTLGVKLGD